MKKGFVLLVLLFVMFFVLGCGHTHVFEDATCTDPKTCEECGATEGEKLGHTWLDATCADPKMCKTCEKTKGEALGHTWNDATCEAPKTCNECKTIEGKALGHNWHKATCLLPNTCSECGETEGDALGHTWVDATCTAPKTCSSCKETEGEALEHTWVDATCTAPKTCSVCKETEGEALGHTPGEWIAEEPDYSSVYYSVKQYCSVCDAYMDSDIVFFNTMHEDGLFLFSPEEFAEKLESFYSVLGYNMTTNLAVLDDNTLACGIFYRGDVIAAVLFNNDYSEMDGDEKDAHTMSSMMVYYYTDEVSYVVKSMIGIMIACDPTLEEDDAKTLGSAVVSAAQYNDNYEHNGITYALTVVKNQYLFVASVLDK